jgi:uncharacterized protein YPO0396
MSNKSNAGQPSPHLHSAPAQPKAEAVTGDLERLRDIIFGQHARTIEERLNAVEAEVERLHRELTEALNSLGDTSASELTTARRELKQRLDEQVAAHAQALQQSFDSHRSEQAAQFGNIERRIEQLSADLFAQMRMARQELTERLDHGSTDSRQRHDALRQEILALIKSLDESKSSRQDLGQMLIELGRKIQGQD